MTKRKGSDAKEGTNIYAPAGGLKIDKNNLGKFSTLEGFRMESVKAGEIMVLCLSKSIDDRTKKGFGAVACAEILDGRSSAVTSKLP